MCEVTLHACIQSYLYSNNYSMDDRNNINIRIINVHILLCNVMYVRTIHVSLSKWRPCNSFLPSFLSNSSCIIYHYVAKQLLHLIWYSIPYQINLATGYIATKEEFMVCGFFHREKKCDNLFGNTISYSMGWRMLLYKWIFGWYRLSSIVLEKKGIKQYIFKEFS